MRYIFLGCILLVSCKRLPTVHPEKKTIVETVYASGQILSKGEGKVFSLSNGVIVQKLVKDGQAVKKGQLLYVIQSDAAEAQEQAAHQSYQQAQSDASDRSPVLKDVQLALSSAIARFRLDSANYRRDSILFYTNQVGTAANLDRSRLTYQLSLNQRRSAEQKLSSTKNQLKIGLAAAKSQMAGATQLLSTFELRSNADGVVFETYKEQGETVRIGELLALMGNEEERIIKLSVDQQDIAKVQVGQHVLIRTDVTADRILQAKVAQVYRVMNAADQTFRVDAVFTDQTELPFLHASVEGNIIIQQKENVWVVPRSALKGADSLKVLLDGKEGLKRVKLGIQTLEQAEVLEGVDANTEMLNAPSK